MQISKDRIIAVVLRHLYLQMRDLIRFADVTYWPAIDMIFWGFSSTWAVTQGADQQVITAMLICSILWQVVFRTNVELSANIMEEIWERNVLNLFSTPLTFTEWIIGLMLVGFVRVFLVFFVCVLVSYYAFNFSIIEFGLIPLSAAISCLIFIGWSMGLFNAAIVLAMGRRAQTMPWILGWMLAPFCGVFSDVSVLPDWMRVAGSFIPMTQIFEATRSYVVTGEFNYFVLVKAFFESLIFCIAGSWVLKNVFDRCRDRGLRTLE